MRGILNFADLIIVNVRCIARGGEVRVGSHDVWIHPNSRLLSFEVAASGKCIEFRSIIRETLIWTLIKETRHDFGSSWSMRLCLSRLNFHCDRRFDNILVLNPCLSDSCIIYRRAGRNGQRVYTRRIMGRSILPQFDYGLCNLECEITCILHSQRYHARWIVQWRSNHRRHLP